MKYIAYDFETTGLDWRRDQPIEIGMVVADERTGAVDEYDIFIKTAEPLVEEVKNLTKITDEMLAAHGIELEAAMKQMFDVLGMRPDGVDEDVVIIGHNIIGFDNWFLKKYAEEYGYQMPAIEQFFDTAGAFRGMLLGEERFVHECDHDYHDRILRLDVKGARYNLTAACNHYGIQMDKQAHRAHNDCRYTLQVYEKMTNKRLLGVMRAAPSGGQDGPQQTAAAEEKPPEQTVAVGRQQTVGQGAFNF